METRIKAFFFNIDYSILGQSFKEVFWMTSIALFPLIINIVIYAFVANNLIEPLQTKVIPGEILSYCLSFIAPSLYLLTKLQGSQYKLPFLHGFSIVTLIIYVLTIVLYLVIKNHWVKEINSEVHSFDLYFKTTIFFLIITIVFRIYTLYHSKNSINWSENRNKQQQDFNTTFTGSIK